MFVSAISVNMPVNSLQNAQKAANAVVTNPIEKKGDEFKTASKAFSSYFLGGQNVTFGGTSGFKIKKLEDVPCPCCGQIMLTPESTEKHVKILNMAKGNKLADRIVNEEAKFLRSNERAVAFMAANAAKGTELNLAGAINKDNAPRSC